jgi:hypothetical protein
MASYASGVRVRLAYVAETTRGVTPGSPSMKTLRATERAINLTKGILETAEVRVDRQIADQRHGFNQVGGTVGFELSSQAYDDMLEATLGGAWTTGGNSPRTGSTTIQATAYNSTGPVYGTFVLSSGSFWTMGFAPGMSITSAGFVSGGNNTTNNMIRAISTDGLTATMDATTMAADAAAAARTITAEGEVLSVNNILKTFTFERRFEDIAQYEVFKGVTINDLSLEISPTRMIGGTLTMLGMSATARSGSTLGAPAAAPALAPYSAFDARLLIGASDFAAMTSMRINLRNNRQVQPVISSKFTPDVFDGRCMIDGDASFFLTDTSTLDNYFMNETDTPITCVIKMIGLAGDYLTIMMPRVKFNAATKNPPQEGPVTVAGTFAALRDALSGNEMFIQRSNA